MHRRTFRLGNAVMGLAFMRNRRSDNCFGLGSCIYIFTQYGVVTLAVGEEKYSYENK